MLGDGQVPTLSDDFINVYLGADYITTLPEQEYVDIAAGSAHTCVVSATGDLYCWGFSAHGQTGGDGYYEEARATPTTVSGFPEDSKVVSVAAGLLHTCVIVAEENDADPTDGDVYVWFQPRQTVRPIRFHGDAMTFIPVPLSTVNRLRRK